MKCQQCNTDLPGEARFCPHCGSGLVAADASDKAKAASAQPSASATQEHTGETSTLQMHPGSFMLPARFKKQLQSGTPPEAVIWNLFRHKSEMRLLLESIATIGQPEERDKKVAEAKSFLQSHCIVCGERTELFEEGQTPICAHCR